MLSHRTFAACALGFNFEGSMWVLMTTWKLKLLATSSSKSVGTRMAPLGSISRHTSCNLAQEQGDKLKRRAPKIL